MNRPATRVLFVCLGNICRSPTAAGVLRHLASREAPHLQLEIDSAGMADYHRGEPPDLRTQRAAKQRGIDLSGLRARQVEPDDFAHFDLILAMDRQNLRALQAMRPRGATAQLRLFLEYAADTGGNLEVPDPYYGDAGDFEHVLDLISAAARALIASLEKSA
jgi:protein-tyrosine phosphatase